MRSLVVVLVLALVALPGCGAMVFQNPEEVRVFSNVPAFVRGHGRVPGALKLDRSRDAVLLVEAEGCRPETVRIQAAPSWWRIAYSVLANGAHGLFTFFISTGVGLAIDAGAGAWQTLEPEEVTVTLTREGEVPRPEGEASARR